MNLKLIIIICFSYFYGFFEIFMSIRQRRNRKLDIVQKGDKASIYLLLSLIAIGFYLAFQFGMSKTGRIYHWNTMFAIGVILVIAGMIIRITSIQTLKQHFTFTVTKIEGHELIESGLYKYIRHPGYLGQILLFGGIGISMSNWLSAVSMLIPVCIGFIYRIYVEEKFMTQQMGKAYLDYKSRTKRLIPFFY